MHRLASPVRQDEARSSSSRTVAQRVPAFPEGNLGVDSPIAEDSEAPSSDDDVENGEESEEEASAVRADQWREQYGLTDDGDFAFYFSGYKQAMEEAGQEVADAWSKERTLHLIS